MVQECLDNTINTDGENTTVLGFLPPPLGDYYYTDGGIIFLRKLT